MTRVLIELAWFIGCSMILGLMLVGLIVMLVPSHYKDDRLEPVFDAMMRTLLITICLMQIFIPNSEITMKIFLYVYNFLRLCFGDNMTRMGRLQWFLNGFGVGGRYFLPLFVFIFIYCFIRHFVTAQKGERTTALMFLPGVILIELIMLMCIADRIITLLLGMLFFGSVFMSAHGTVYNEAKELRDKGFAESYKSKDSWFTFTAHDILGDNNHVKLVKEWSGHEVIAYKNEDGTLIDEDGNKFYPN